MSFSPLGVDLRSNRYGACAVLHDGKIFIFGGSDGTTYLSSCEVFDPGRNNFTTLPTAMGSKRWGACAVALGGLVYLFGGHDGNSELSSCEVLDPSSMTFATLPSAMRSKRLGACAVTQRGRIFIFGGHDGSSELSSCEVFDPTSNTFTTLSRTMSSKRIGACAVAQGGQIFVFGGRQGSTYLSNYEIFDPSSSTFAVLPIEMCSKREGAFAVAHESLLFVFGGRQGSTYLSSCELFDPDHDNTFTTLLEPMRIKRDGLCGAAQGGRIFIFGGSDGGRILSSCEVYNPPRSTSRLVMRVSQLQAELSAMVSELDRLRAVDTELTDSRARCERLEQEKQQSDSLLAASREEIRQLQEQASAMLPLFDPQAPYAWNQARFPSSRVDGGGTRPSFLVNSPDCPADVRSLVEELMATRGRYRSGLVAGPVAGFQVHRIEIVDRSATTLQALQARLQILQNLRSTRVPEVWEAEHAVNEDAEMLRVVGALKELFVTRNRRTNAVLTFHGTREDCVEDILSAGLQKYCREDNGYFGYGCYTTPSLEYAAQYASGDLSSGGPRQPRDGCWPVVLFAAAVGLAYPVTRARAYATPGVRHSKSRFYGEAGEVRPLFNGAVDTHVAGVAQGYFFQAAPVNEVEYLELVSAETQALHPLAVLWVKK